MGAGHRAQKGSQDRRDAAGLLDQLILDADMLSLHGRIGADEEEAFFRCVNEARKMLTALGDDHSHELRQRSRDALREELLGLLLAMQSDLVHAHARNATEAKH